MPAATSEELAQLAKTNVIVHPLVLLSVVDHADRVAKGSKKRVVGILLGQDEGNTINVTNSFAVPFEEDEKDPRTWFIDHNYIETMRDMFKKVAAKERLVGWYHSGPKLRASDLEINQVVKRFTAKPVMVIVDVRRKDSTIPTDAYLAVEEIKDDGTASQKTFMHVPSTIEAEEAEEIGVEHLLRDIKDFSSGTLANRVSERLQSLAGLASHLGEIREYLDAVLKGEMDVNHQILYNLQDIFNLLPNLEAMEKGVNRDEDDRPFTVATNDQLLIVYLSSLIRAIIALHSLVNNKISNQQDPDAPETAKGSDDAADKQKVTPKGEIKDVSSNDRAKKSDGL